MKYYKTDCGKLIKFNEQTSKYRVTSSPREFILQEDFILLNTKEIKLNEFSRLMNEHYSIVKDNWIYNGIKYQNLDTFGSSKYFIGVDVPFHTIPHNNHVVLVYHWGKVYYHTVSYNGDRNGQLFDIQTGQYVRWANIKNCSPILNMDTQQII